jgi:hypothetical protein
MSSKSAPALGFDFNELEASITQYEPPSKGAVPAHSAPQGRPRILPLDSVTFSVRLSRSQRDWLVREAAQRTLASGERHDTSMLVRELIDQARDKRGEKP